MLLTAITAVLPSLCSLTKAIFKVGAFPTATGKSTNVPLVASAIRSDFLPDRIAVEPSQEIVEALLKSVAGIRVFSFSVCRSHNTKNGSSPLLVGSVASRPQNAPKDEPPGSTTG